MRHRGYQLLLRVFPAAFRARFGEDMAEVFRDRLAGARRRGLAAVGALWLTTIRDVVRHGVAERRQHRRLRLALRGEALMTSLLQDFRYALRYFIRRPAFTLLAVITLALGIGANTAIFSVVRSVLLAPLPYRDVDRLAVISHPADDITHLSLREVLSYREEASALPAVSGYTETALDFTGSGEPERVIAAAVMADLFSVLGVTPVHGRLFGPEDAAPGAPRVVAISDRLWQRRFAGDPSVVGQTVLVNGRPATIAAIMPAHFRLPRDFQSDRPSEAWMPVTVDPANLGTWGNRSFIGVARLGAGVTADAAAASMFAVSQRWLAAGFVQDHGDGRLQRQVTPVRDFVVGRVRAPILILAGAVVAVLLIACANVVNLLLAQGEIRRREVAVRVALGAQRGQIARQLLAESLLLAAAGGAAGVGLAIAGTRALIAIRPAFMPRVAEAAIDLTALLFTAGLSLVAALIVGAAPALAMARGNSSMDGGVRGAGVRRVRARTRRALVVLQLAAAVVLVIAAGLLVRTLIAMTRTDLGFDPRGVLTLQLQLPSTTYPAPADVVAFYQRAIDRIEAVPGVTAAGAIRLLPLTRAIGNWSITVEGAPREPGDNPNGDFQWATGGYFEAMRTPVRRGRAIDDTDRGDAPLVAVVNETMAARYWPGQDAIGRRFRMGTGDQPWVEVVGVLGRTRHNRVAEPPRAEMYLPHAQLPRSVGGAPRAMALVIRTDGDPAALAAPIRAALRDLDPQLPVSDVRTLEQITRDAMSETRFAALLLGLLAALALTLAAIGVYGTMSVLVSERTAEIGIRMALGARRSAIVRLVVVEGVGLAGVGAIIGLAAAAAGAFALRSLVYEVSTHDPLTFALVPMVLLMVAFTACLRPAMRAAATDPTQVMR